MKGLGFASGGGGREAKDSEPEEGKACLGKEEDDCIDPDVDLSYIVRRPFFFPPSRFSGGFSFEECMLCH